MRRNDHRDAINICINLIDICAAGVDILAFAYSFLDKTSKALCTVCPGSSYPNLYNELLYKMGNYFLDI